MKARKKKTLGQPHLGEQLRELHGASVVLDGLCIRVVDAVLVVGECAVRVVQALARPVPLRSNATLTLQTSPSLASLLSSLSFGVLHVTFGKTARAELAAQHERLGLSQVIDKQDSAQQRAAPFANAKPTQQNGNSSKF